MNNILRFSTAPSNIAEIKSNIFTYHTKQQISFKANETFIYEDEYFKVELKGYKLNQIHKDILDIILYMGGNEFDGKLQDNRFVRTISLYKIKQYLGYKSSNNIKWIENKIHEMQQTLIQVTDKKSLNQDKWNFSIIETSKHSKKLNTYAVIIHPLYYQFFGDNISLNYSHYLKDILNLKNGITKATIRFLLTHKNGININIDNLLQKVGVRGGKRNLEKHRKNLLNELENIKELFGIKLLKMSSDNRRKNDFTIIYKRLPEIQFYHPKNITN